MGVTLCGDPERAGLSSVQAHVLRQLRGVLEAAWTERAGVRWTSARTVGGAVPRQVAGSLESFATSTTSKGLEVRVRHTVALQPQRARKDTSALWAAIALARTWLSRGRLALRRAPRFLLQLHRVRVGDPVGVDEQMAAQPRWPRPRHRGRSGGGAFRLGKRGSLGGRWVHDLRRGGPRVGWPRRQQQHLERQPVQQPLGSGGERGRGPGRTRACPDERRGRSELPGSSGPAAPGTRVGGRRGARGDGVPEKEHRSETPATHTKVPRLESAAVKGERKGWGWRLANEKDLQKDSFQLRAIHKSHSFALSDP